MQQVNRSTVYAYKSEQCSWKYTQRSNALDNAVRKKRCVRSGLAWDVWIALGRCPGNSLDLILSYRSPRHFALTLHHSNR